MSIKRILQQKNKTYYKHNFVDLMRNYIPELYIDEDIQEYGVSNDILYEVLGGLVDLTVNLSSTIYLSGIDTVEQYRTLFSLDAPYASLGADTVYRLLDIAGSYKSIRHADISVAEQIKRFDLGSIQQAFQRVGLNTKKESLIENVLPQFRLNSPDWSVLSELSDSITDTASAHQYMFDTYGWLYILNNFQLYDSETKYTTCEDLLIEALEKTTFIGKPFTLSDGILAFIEYLQEVEDRS